MRTTSALDESASMAAPRRSAAKAEVTTETCIRVFYRAGTVQDVDGSSHLPDEEAVKRTPRQVVAIRPSFHSRRRRRRQEVPLQRYAHGDPKHMRAAVERLVGLL